jgi:ketosteroid isomerase-like protein
MGAEEELEKFVEQYHRSMDAFARGDPEPAKALFSRSDDVVLANPFGPGVRGWKDAAARMEAAAGKYRDGEFRGAERLGTFIAPELACMFEIEHWHARVGGRTEFTDFVLRTTTTVRREGGAWKVVHRHADPIAAMDQEGPLRKNLG